MRTNRQGLLNKLPTVAARLCGEAGVHSNNLMTSSCSLIFKDIEECTPTGVHDALCHVMVLDHTVDVQFLNGDLVIALAVALGNLIMKISTLTSNLEMGLCGPFGCLASALAALLSASDGTLFAPECGLILAVVSGVGNSIPFAVSQEGLEADINADVRMLTRRRKMRSRWLGFTDNEGVPMPVRTMHQVACLRCSFYRTMQLDLEGRTQLLGNRQMLPIRGKREINLVLAQLDGVPAIRCLETGEAAFLTEFSHGKAPFEGFIQAICQHLHRRGGHMFTALSFETSGQIVFQEKLPCLLILFLGSRQHLVIEMPRLGQTRHEQAGLCLIRIKAVFKRSHGKHFNANQLICQEGEGTTYP